jgi:tryptophan-rich sensory protein
MTSRWKPIALAAGAALLVAVIGGGLTDTGPWYQSLRKPWFQPPDWLFAPAWTLIYSLTAIAGVQSWRAAPPGAQRDWLLVAFAANGFLNVLWSLLFFGLRRPDWALVEVVFLFLSVALLIWLAGRHAPVARWLLAPYLLWVGFAGVLNLAVVRLNAPF